MSYLEFDERKFRKRQAATICETIALADVDFKFENVGRRLDI